MAGMSDSEKVLHLAKQSWKSWKSESSKAISQFDRMNTELAKHGIEFHKLKKMKASSWMPDARLKKCERALGAVEVSDAIHTYRNTCTCMM